MSGQSCSCACARERGRIGTFLERMLMRACFLYVYQQLRPPHTRTDASARHSTLILCVSFPLASPPWFPTPSPFSMVSSQADPPVVPVQLISAAVPHHWSYRSQPRSVSSHCAAAKCLPGNPAPLTSAAAPNSTRHPHVRWNCNAERFTGRQVSERLYLYDNPARMLPLLSCVPLPPPTLRSLRVLSLRADISRICRRGQRQTSFLIIGHFPLLMSLRWSLANKSHELKFKVNSCM